MLKETKKQHIRVKHLLQSYALARPYVRLSLRTLSSNAKKKSDGDDWTYACKTSLHDNTVRGAAMQVIGRECTNQCIWKTFRLDGYEAQALLPKADADFKKVMGYGHFLSVDARPVRANGESTRATVMYFKEKLKENCHIEDVRDPFLFLNMRCPGGSYDSSLEPSKNDVAFENPTLVLQLVRRLISDSYPVSARISLPLENLSEDDKSIHPRGSQLPQCEPRDKPCDTSRTPNRRGPDQRNCESGMLTPDKSDLNPWVLAKLHSGLGKRKNRADTFAPPLEHRQVGGDADGDTGRIYGSDLEYHTFLPSPLPSSPLNHQGNSRRQFENQKFTSQVISSPINSTPRRKTRPQAGTKSKIARQSPTEKKNDIPSFEKLWRHSTFSCNELQKPSISKPFVSPLSSCGAMSTPFHKRQGLQICNIENNNCKAMQASTPSACTPAGASSELIDTGQHDCTEDSHSECKLQLDWLKDSMTPLIKGSNNGNNQDILRDKGDYSLRIFSLVRTSAAAIQRSLSVLGDVVLDDLPLSGSSLLGSRALGPPWNDLTRGDIEKYASTLAGLLSSRGITVQTDRLTQSIEEAVLHD